MTHGRKSEGGPSWEARFGDAVEDASTYAWAVEVLARPPEGYTPGFLLERALAARARTRRALAALDNAPAEYRPHRQKLAAMWKRAEKALSSLAADPASPAHQGAADLARRVEQAGGGLALAERAAQDARLMDDAPWATKELYEVSSDFLLRFHRLALAAGELAVPPADKLSAGGFLEAMEDLDRSFSKKFGIMHAAAPVLEALRGREHGMDAWWLSTSPRAEDLPVPGEAREHHQALEKAFRVQVLASSPGCPQRNRTLLYVAGDLELSQMREAREHLAHCAFCRELAEDARLAVDAGADHPPAPPEWLWSAAQGAPAGEGKRGKGPKTPWSGARWAVASAAAMVLLAVGLVLFLTAWPSGNETTTPGEGPLPSAATAPNNSGPGFRPPPVLAAPSSASLGVRSPGGQGVRSLLPGDSLSSGDPFGVVFEVSSDAWVYVAFWSSSGEAQALFSGLVSGGKEYALPPSGWFHLDEHPGVETLVLVASGVKIPDFPERMKRAGNPEALGALFPSALVRFFSFGHR
ncbi:MAG: DUF4384 domain-containing protein [Deltaproteobacteria bacterium]|nr:DUF4384 domain-containing protein [Deltaproteobacteria bacterium]